MLTSYLLAFLFGYCTSPCGVVRLWTSSFLLLHLRRTGHTSRGSTLQEPMVLCTAASHHVGLFVLGSRRITLAVSSLRLSVFFLACVTCGTNANTMSPYPLHVQRSTDNASSFFPQSPLSTGLGTASQLYEPKNSEARFILSDPHSTTSTTEPLLAIS